jgi:hypothetical protein
MKLPPSEKIPHDSFSTDDDFQTIINGEDPPEEDAEAVREWIIDFDYDQTSCPYCKTVVTSQQYERGDFDGDDWGRFAYLAECENCGYWHCFVNQFNDRPMFSSVGWYAWISKLKEFDHQVPSECTSELAQSLRRHARWGDLEPRQLEKLVADVFKANFKQAEVFHVGKPDDGGVDVLFVDSGTKCLIQVKRRIKYHKGEGVEVIRNLLGSMLLGNVLRGVVVSTADHFTYRAYDAIGRASERGMIVELIDRGKLNRMLDPLLPKRQWRSILSEFDPSLRKYFVQKFIETSRDPERKRKMRKGQLDLF